MNATTLNDFPRHLNVELLASGGDNEAKVIAL
jgi:hypothetical protein